MYCRHCGERLNDNQAICVKCGVLVGKGELYCPNCGKEVMKNADVCVSCGYQINDIRDIHRVELPPKKRRSKRKFSIRFTIIAILATIFLLIPNYIFIEYGKRTLDYSFIEWMGEISIIVLLLLWTNPIISFIGIKQNKDYSFTKIIISTILIVLVPAMSMDAGDGFGPMFLLTMLVLFIQESFSIAEGIGSLRFNKPKQCQVKNKPMPMVERQSTTASNRIFCKNCGVEMSINQAICIKCGVSVGKGNLYCSNCGNAISENAEFCMHCGVVIQTKKYLNQHSTSVEYPGGQDKTTLALICFFLGGLGAHHFIMGERKKGIMKIVLCFAFGFSAILALADFINILTDKYEVNYDTYF